MKQLILPLLLVLFSANQTLQAEIFKWTDKDGKVHYSATPPKEPQKNIENIEDKIKANIGKVQPPTDYKAPVAKEEKTEEDKKEPANNSPDSKAKDPYEGDRSPARVAYCGRLKNNIHTLEANQGRKIVKEGDKEPLTSKQVAAQLEKAKTSLSKNCVGI